MEGYIWQKKVYIIDITDIISFIILQSGLSALQNKEYSYLKKKKTHRQELFAKKKRGKFHLTATFFNDKERIH